MVQLTISEIYNRHSNGEALASLIPDGADLAYWEKQLVNYEYRLRNPKPKRRRRERRGTPKATVNYANDILWKRNS